MGRDGQEKRSADHVSQYSLIDASIPEKERGIVKNRQPESIFESLFFALTR